MIYTHVLNKGVLGVRSPADMLGKNGQFNLANPPANLSAELQKHLTDIVNIRYHGHLEAAILAFLDLHGTVDL